MLISNQASLFGHLNCFCEQEFYICLRLKKYIRMYSVTNKSNFSELSKCQLISCPNVFHVKQIITYNHFLSLFWLFVLSPIISLDQRFTSFLRQKSSVIFGKSIFLLCYLHICGTCLQFFNQKFLFRYLLCSMNRQQLITPNSFNCALLQIQGWRQISLTLVGSMLLVPMPLKIWK